MSGSRKWLLKQAKKQIEKQSAESGLSLREQIQFARDDGTIANKTREIDYSELRNSENTSSSTKDLKTKKRKAKRRIRSQERRARYQKYRAGEDISKIVWNYETGMLVKIRPEVGHFISRHNLNVGDTGVIVSAETDRVSGTNRELQVMGPNGLEMWIASWVEIVGFDDE